MRKREIICLALFCFMVAAAEEAGSFSIIQTAQELEGRQLENKKKWTKLLKDMPMDQVKEILGGPDRVSEGVGITIWFYQKGGSVEFSGGKIVKITKPYSWDY